MKKIYAFILLSGVLTMHASAQFIQSFTVIPANPTSTDSVKIIIECLFNSGGCDGTAYLGGISGNQIDAGALHCMGALSVICTDYDTVVLPPLAADQYTFTFVLSTGQGIPCIPGIIPIDVDTVSFTVSDATGIPSLSDADYFQVSPNPSTGRINIKNNSKENSLIKIFSADGSLVKSIQLNDRETEIESSLSAGVYIIVLEDKNRSLFRKLTVLN